jgi:hypothetical protein
MKPMLCLFFISFLACKNSKNSKSDTPLLKLAGKKFSYTTDVSYVNTSVCEFSCECDCGMGDFIFNENETCYFSDFCCCGNPETYYKGKYRILDEEVICEFGEKYISEYDATTTEMNEQDISPIHPIPIIKQGKIFTYRFKIGYCTEGTLYLYDENKNKTYLHVKSEIQPQAIRFSKSIDSLLKSNQLTN